jgi:beta-lactamase class A
VAVAAKSGGLLGILRNEIGVLTYPDNTAYAVAVFTRTQRTTPDGRTIDNTIGHAAQHAVQHLRERPPR